MRDEQLKAIREKCIAANPTRYPEHWNREHSLVRLADVLLAMQKATGHIGYIFVSGEGEFLTLTAENDIEEIRHFPDSSNWNLRKDNLTEQFDETISFIYEVLK